MNSVTAQRRWSVGSITSPGTVLNGKPEIAGLSDVRMGVVDKAGKCSTDGASLLECPGYFGHIELAKPMFHIGFFTTVIKVLRCVSFEGSKLMVEKVSCMQGHAAKVHDACLGVLDAMHCLHQRCNGKRDLYKETDAMHVNLANDWVIVHGAVACDDHCASMMHLRHQSLCLMHA